jgi:hypothetical protein
LETADWRLVVIVGEITAAGETKISEWVAHVGAVFFRIALIGLGLLLLAVLVIWMVLAVTGIFL